MAQTRQSLKENTWGRLKKAFPQIFAPQQDSETQIRVRVVIPLCVGYSEKSLVSFDNLNAWVEGVIEKGFSDFIFEDPKDAQSLRQREKEFTDWKKANPQSLLSKLPANHFHLADNMRQKENWKKAFDLVQSISEGASFKKALLEDVKRFTPKHDEISEQDAKLHFIKTAADYLSFMQSEEDWKREKQITALFYEHGLSNTMRFINDNAHSYNYRSESIVHLKPKCKSEKLVASSHREEAEEGEALLTKLMRIMAKNEIPPHFSGPALAEACRYMEGKNLANQGSSNSYSLINECLTKSSSVEKKQLENPATKSNVSKETEKKRTESSSENIGKNSFFNHSSIKKEKEKEKKEEARNQVSP